MWVIVALCGLGDILEIGTDLYYSTMKPWFYIEDFTAEWDVII